MHIPARRGDRVMDWFNAWERVPYRELELVDSPAASGQFTALLVVGLIVLAAMVMWHRQRVVRHAFWCATAGRDVEMRRRCGRVQSCSVFDDPTAIACARQCIDPGFRVQWPPAERRSGVRGGPVGAGVLSA
jgi:hypothetical protein